MVQRDKPWVMRTYSGHSTAKASNELYRTNLAKGQTGLSIAFDLPTQIGYDPDSPEAAGEVGKVGVPVAHLGHMSQLLDQIPVESMNTSMTINATAAWLLGLYIANAEDRGVDPRVLSGTTQNDIVKEYLSRGTFIFPPLPSRRLTVGHHRLHRSATCPSGTRSTSAATTCRRPGPRRTRRWPTPWPPPSGCSTPCASRGQIPEAEFSSVVGRISFFVNAGVRFVEETCKMRAFTALWDRVCSERYGVTDPKLRRNALRRAGQLAGPDRGPAGEQRPPHRPRVPRGHPVQERPGARAAAAGVERGPRSAPSVGPAVVPPHPADPRLRVRPAGVRGHLRRLRRHRGEDGRGGRGLVGRAAGGARSGRGVRSHRRTQIAVGGQPVRTGPPYRDRRAPGGRGQLLHRDGRLAPGPRRDTRPRPPAGRSSGSTRPSSPSYGPTWRRGEPTGTTGGSTRRSTSSAGRRRGPTT